MNYPLCAWDPTGQRLTSEDALLTAFVYAGAGTTVYTIKPAAQRPRHKVQRSFDYTAVITLVQVCMSQLPRLVAKHVTKICVIDFG